MNPNPAIYAWGRTILIPANLEDGPYRWYFYGIVAVLILASVVATIFELREAARRVGKMRNIARQFKLEFGETTKYAIPDFEMFRVGIRNRTEKTMIGPLHGHVVQAGDFFYETVTSTDKEGNVTTTQHRFSYCWVRTPAALFVDLTIRPEGFFDKLKAVAGMVDINFESAEFSHKFYVTSLDRKFAYDVICPRMMEYLLGRPGYTVLLNYSGLLILQGEAIWQADAFPGAMNFACAFLERIPAHVWDTYKSNKVA